MESELDKVLSEITDVKSQLDKKSGLIKEQESELEEVYSELIKVTIKIRNLT